MLYTSHYTSIKLLENLFRLHFAGIKRLIGRCYSDWSAKNDCKFLPFKIVCGDRNRSMVAVQYKNEEKLFAPEEIAAMISTLR